MYVLPDDKSKEPTLKEMSPN